MIIINKIIFGQSAVAYVKGGKNAPLVSGKVEFYQRTESVLIVARILGLPESSHSGFFGFHIHEGEKCSGDNFSDTGSHYNPSGASHPMHAGDLPPLMLCNGGAYMAVETSRFRLEDVIGRTVVIHSGADDFMTQPAGNAGEKIACGVIRCR